MLRQLVYHVGEDVLGLVRVVLVRRLLPPGVHVRVRHDDDVQHLQVLAVLVHAGGERKVSFVT